MGDRGLIRPDPDPDPEMERPTVRAEEGRELEKAAPRIEAPRVAAPGIVAPGIVAPGIVAHRGASGDFPEHTRAAFEAALEQGADAIECDVRLTKDRHLVCIHDRTVDRTSDGTGVVSELTLAQLRELNFAPGTDLPPQPIVSLADLLELVRDRRAPDGNPVRLFIETKHPVRYGRLVEEKLLALLQNSERLQNSDQPDPIGWAAGGADARVQVISFSGKSVWRIRRGEPELLTVLLGGATRLGGAAAAVKASGIGPSIASLRQHPETVAKAAALGRYTYCWTVDAEADLALCRRLGVRWIATNHPGRARNWLTAAGNDEPVH